MPQYTSSHDEQLAYVVKRLLNQPHSAAAFLPGQDGGWAGAGKVPSHLLLSAEQVVGQELPSTPPALGHDVSNGLVRRFGSVGDPPAQALEFQQLLSVPARRGWILVDGDSAADTPWAQKPPAIGFLDAWAGGQAQAANSNGQTYAPVLYYGASSPEHELSPGHPSGPTFDTATGVLTFAEDPTDHGIESTDRFFFTGWLYVGESLAERVARLATKWVSARVCVTSELKGVATQNTVVRIRLAPRSAGQAALVLHNGRALMPPFDCTISANGAVLLVTQQRHVLRVGDYLTVFYQTFL